MSWTPLTTNNIGDEVMTPFGKGTIKKISGNGYSVVEVDGAKYDIDNGSIEKLPSSRQHGQLMAQLIRDDAGTAIEPKKGDAVNTFKKGDRVTRTDGSGNGIVTSVTQRSVKVVWRGRRGERAYPKKEAGNFIKTVDNRDKPKEQPEEQPKEQPETAEPDSEGTAHQLYGLLQLQKHLEKKIDDSVDKELKDIRDIAKSKQQLEVKIGDKVNSVKGAKHRQLETLITYAGLRLNTLLVGMAGTGKTFAAEQAAEALGIDFYAVSVGAQTSKSDIIGYMDANGKYVRTHFRDAYEKGGVFLMDEIDAGNANVLIQVNAALSNGYMSFPDAMVRKHEDFVFIASANTYGNGANRQYVGRNQLDAATLDRFAIIDWLIDDELEHSLASGKYGDAWYRAVRAVRDFVKEKGIRALISPRATQKGSQLLSAGINVDEVINSVLVSSVPEDKKADIIKVAVSVFDKGAADVPSGVIDDIVAIDYGEL